MNDSAEKVINDIIYIWTLYYSNISFQDFLKKILNKETEASIKTMRSCLNKFLIKEGLMK